jgi:hypothetical protein
MVMATTRTLCRSGSRERVKWGPCPQFRPPTLSAWRNWSAGSKPRLPLLCTIERVVFSVVVSTEQTVVQRVQTGQTRGPLQAINVIE